MTLEELAELLLDKALSKRQLSDGRAANRAKVSPKGVEKLKETITHVFNNRRVKKSENS